MAKQEKPRSRAHGQHVAGCACLRLVSTRLGRVPIEKEVAAFEELITSYDPIPPAGANQCGIMPNAEAQGATF